MRNRQLLERVSSDLIRYETVDANHLEQLIEEYAVDKAQVEPPYSNEHRRRVAASSPATM